MLLLAGGVMDNELHDFRLQLRQLLSNPTGLPEPGIKVAKAIHQRLEAELLPAPRTKQINPLRDLLPQVAAAVDDLPAALQPLVNSLLGLTDYLVWYTRPAPRMPEFMQGHANADIIGPRGLAVSEDIQIGVTLMRPGITYPDHHHLPEEVYIVLSEGGCRQKKTPGTLPAPVGMFTIRPILFMP